MDTLRDSVKKPIFESTFNFMRTMRPYFLILLALLLVGAGTAPAQQEQPVYLSGSAANPYVPSYGVYAPNEEMVYIPLSGTWTLEPEWGAEQKVTVPGCWSSGRGGAVLRTSFEIADSLDGKHFRLVFWGVRQRLNVRVNGRLVEVWEGDLTTMIVDLPQRLLAFGDLNSLEVELDDRLSSRASIPLKPKLYDDLPYMGIFGDVALVGGPTTVLDNVDWQVELNENRTSAAWKLNLRFRSMGSMVGDSLSTKTLTITPSWVSPDGEDDWEGAPVELTLGQVEAADLALEGVIRQPKLWSPQMPQRYMFTLGLSDGARSWTVQQPLGIRSMRWTPDGLEFNGRLMEIWGVDLLQESARRGLALTTEEVEADLTEIQEIGFNMVRMLGPAHPATAELCDRKGLWLITHTGLRNVPTPLFVDEQLQTRLYNTLAEQIRLSRLHPSIIAWGVADWVAAEPAVLEMLGHLVEKTREYDSRPLLIGMISTTVPDLPDGVVGMTQRPPYELFQPVEPAPEETDAPWLIGGLGGFVSPISVDENKTKGQDRLGDALMYQFDDLADLQIAGFSIDAYADRKGAWPLLIGGASDDPAMIERGLCALDRSIRIAIKNRVKKAFQLDLKHLEVPAIDEKERPFPLIFPITTLAIAAILMLLRRQNNVFRQHLDRVFAHTYGFFVDIRDRRYFQISQTLTLSVVVSVSQAVLLASWLYHVRDNYLFDYVATLLLPFWQVKFWLVKAAWSPTIATAGFAVLHFILMVLLATALRMLAIPFRQHISIKQTFNLVVWGATNFLLLIPLGLVHYRLLEYEWYMVTSALLMGLFTLWYLARISSMFRIVFRIRAIGAWVMIIIISLVMLGAFVSIYESAFALLENVDHFITVILPWA